jgi:hypothetical protein
MEEIAKRVFRQYTEKWKKLSDRLNGPDKPGRVGAEPTCHDQVTKYRSFANSQQRCSST